VCDADLSWRISGLVPCEMALAWFRLPRMSAGSAGVVNAWPAMAGLRPESTALPQFGHTRKLSLDFSSGIIIAQPNTGHAMQTASRLS